LPQFTIATWNINSVRLRHDLVMHFLREHQPDVLCLQETKCPNDMFPFGAFRKFGYEHIAISGKKGYNGVATLSRHPFAATDKRHLDGREEDARHIAVTLGDEAGAGAGLTVHNFYVPAGGDIADPDVNVKFAHKLEFLADLEAMATEGRAARQREIIVGDLNIAPLEHDVWSHKQLLSVVSHTPIETMTLERLRIAGGWIDTARALRPEPEKLYSWWSYRAADWAASNKGRRLDHIWLSDDLGPNATGIEFLSAARGWERPSDHVPVIAALEF
jgi:exodeoxyribonuclease-3